MLKVLCALLLAAMLGSAVATGVATVKGEPPSKEVALVTAGVVLVGMVLQKPMAGVFGMNTYSLFVPYVQTTGVFTAPVSDRLVRTLGYLWMMKKASRSRYGEMAQAIGAAAAVIQAPGMIIDFDTDLRLPADLDVVIGNAAGNLIGTPAAAAPAAAIWLMSLDQQKADIKDNMDVPYPMKGDLVVYQFTASVGRVTMAQIVLVPPSTAGNLGVFVAINNADAIDGVLPNAYSTVTGVALFGPPRESLRLPGTNLAVSPRTVGQAGGSKAQTALEAARNAGKTSISRR